MVDLRQKDMNHVLDSVIEHDGGDQRRFRDLESVSADLTDEGVDEVA